MCHSWLAIRHDAPCCVIQGVLVNGGIHSEHRPPGRRLQVCGLLLLLLLLLLVS
jgi:hypothetical protein